MHFEAGALLNGLNKISGSLLTVRGVMLDGVSLLCPFRVHSVEASNSLAFGSLKRAWTVVESQNPLFMRGASRLLAFIQTISTLSQFDNILSGQRLAFERLLLSQLRPQDMNGLDPEKENLVPLFPTIIERVIRGRQLMISRVHGILGLVPETTTEGDVCCIVARCQVPLILRPAADGSGHYTVVGDAYLHGYMYGEVARDVEAGDAQVTDLTLC